MQTRRSTHLTDTVRLDVADDESLLPHAPGEDLWLSRWHGRVVGKLAHSRLSSLPPRLFKLQLSSRDTALCSYVHRTVKLGRGLCINAPTQNSIVPVRTVRQPVTIGSQA